MMTWLNPKVVLKCLTATTLLWSISINAQTFSSGMIFKGTQLNAGQQPSAAQIDKFCNSQYPKLIQSGNLSPSQLKELEKTYQTYCELKLPNLPALPPAPLPDKPVKPIEPAKPTASIDRIVHPQCLGSGSEIRVLGKNLKSSRLQCEITTSGSRPRLHAYLGNEIEFRYRLDNIVAGSGYTLRCEVAGNVEQVKVKGCAAPDLPIQQATGTVDLEADIDANRLRPGRSETAVVLVRNVGSNPSAAERFDVLLVLTDRDRSSTSLLPGSLLTSGTGSGTILAQQRQNIPRVPQKGQRRRVSMSIKVPATLPEVPLFWCAFVDSTNAVKESRENNNVTCTPANSLQQESTRTDLSNLFGASVRRQNPDLEVNPEIIPTANNALPAGLTPAILGMILKVNDSFGIPPVAVGSSGPMRVTWESLPETVGGDPVMGIQVRFRKDLEFPAGDCGAGSGGWTGDLPIGVLTIDVTDGGGPVSGGGFDVDLDATDPVSGERLFIGGSTYYAKGCLMVDHGGINQFTDHTDGNTNIVPIAYGDTLVAATEMSATIAPLAPDLTGSISSPVRSGPTSIRLPLVFRAQGNAGPGTFHYTLTLLPASEYRGIADAASLHQSPDRVRDLGGIVIGPRAAAVRNLGFGYGNLIYIDVEEYLPDWREQGALVALLDFNTESVSPGATPTYAESRYANNHASRVVGETASAVRAGSTGDVNAILNARHTGYSQLKSLHQVHYASSRSQYRLRLKLLNAPVSRLPSDPGSLVAAVTSYDHVDCLGHHGTASVPTEAGSDRWSNFECIVLNTTFPTSAGPDYAMVAILETDRGTLLDAKKYSAPAQTVNLARAEYAEHPLIRMNLQPTRLATGQWFNAERSGCTPQAFGLGFIFDHTLPSRGANEIMVAINHQERTTNLCTERTFGQAEGFVRFDTDDLSRRGDLEVTRATLRFNRSRDINHRYSYDSSVRPRPGLCPAVPRAAHAAYIDWTGYGDNFDLAVVESRVIPGSITLGLETSGGSSGLFEADATRLAQLWISDSDRAANNGIRLRAPLRNDYPDNTLCGSYFLGFSLELELQPRTGRGSAPGS